MARERRRGGHVARLASVPPTPAIGPLAVPYGRTAFARAQKRLRLLRRRAAPKAVTARARKPRPYARSKAPRRGSIIRAIARK